MQPPARRRFRLKRTFAWFLGLALVYILGSLIGVQIDKTTSSLELLENSEWIATSKHWLDRQACRWIGICGGTHILFKSAWTSSKIQDSIPLPDDDPIPWWESGREDPNSWSNAERKLREIPQYVLDHAPYVHLFSGEKFWPSDVGEHLVHTSPYLNYTKISDLKDRNLTNLNDLNDYAGGEHSRFIYLQSDDNPEERPDWLTSIENIPSPPGRDDDDDDEDDAEAPWPDFDDLKDYDLDALKHQALDQAEKSDEKASTQGFFSDLVPSQDGRCGGSSGYTCDGSKFGSCCSIYGWCGKSEEYCGDPCDPLAGTCFDPYNPPRGPHQELRRRNALDFNDDKHRPQPGGKSSAPAILIVVPKENGIVDAFWFFFYSFNLGQTVLNIRFGNHVGDWEHTCVRFRNGKPYQVFLSEHNFGQAYTWKAMEKYIPSHDGSGTMIGSWSNETAGRMAKRPVVYSALGSHAMYGTPGLHPYILPWGLLHDETDRGPLWDPVQNLQSYTYDAKNRTMRASMLNPTSPVEWLNYAGHWGDKYYPLSDPRQYRFAGQYHYVNGPTGPKFKNLGRKNVCQRHGTCEVRHWLGGAKPATGIPPEEDIEDGTLPGGNQTDDSDTSYWNEPSYSEAVYDDDQEEYSVWTK
ncbi:carbohydrate-binding module family 18 protein [Pseudocercospora fijiensis CIRAD86]|uniref:Carbohydrate-binding module family 18 protein n=1 Tax=Pseudocercospora fijiensis (strain CIRAD86) TaxID=383855 RepID=M2ZQH9_PSEFD|nr:carbohydrate-binding module family 18 protein [Pseudocercospora fijiensis CIRAD86]EME81324.1 carbohydrate-binding module family 18 protein [Pseudocercospora fijiensis CIRAD86]